MLKRLLTIVMITTMISATMIGCGASKGTSNESATKEKSDGKNVSIGSVVFSSDDTFMHGVSTTMEGQAENKGIAFQLLDSKNDQATQDQQVDTLIANGVNALIVNPVDRNSVSSLVEKAKAKNIPIVFLNRQPSHADLYAYDKIWYVGAQAEQSGLLSGKILGDYFKKNPKADKNGDGKVQYVMIEGEPGHQDATLRTEYSVKAIEDTGFKTQKLASDTAMWDKTKATDLMNTFATSQGLDKIEAVLCNNDDMALGAIEALKAAGYNKGDANKYIPVVGVDATTAALRAVKEGSLLGTVLNDSANQGRAAFYVASAAAQGKEMTNENIGYEITDKKYIWINYIEITKDNYKDYIR